MTPEPNGLGAWWFPKRFRRWLTDKSRTFFDDAAWNKHDIGYALGNPSRKICDQKFLQAMLRDASKSDRPETAGALAMFFWFSVRAGGRWSYNQGK